MTSGDASEPTIPQSAALGEAQVESLSELMSRDPEGYGKQDLLAIIAAMREQRKRWEAAEAAEAATGKGKKERTKADASAPAALLKRASGTAEDMGL
jgi:hypothetical protein